jgi:hypothetical protein
MLHPTITSYQRDVEIDGLLHVPVETGLRLGRRKSHISHSKLSAFGGQKKGHCQLGQKGLLNFALNYSKLRSSVVQKHSTTLEKAIQEEIIPALWEKQVLAEVVSLALASYYSRESCCNLHRQL